MDRQLITDAPPAKPTLLERGTELVRVEAVLDRGCLGTGGLMVIEGPAGIGKTSMLSAACAAPQAKGMRLLRARRMRSQRLTLAVADASGHLGNRGRRQRH
jgi:AAA ATPase domain